MTNSLSMMIDVIATGRQPVLNQIQVPLAQRHERFR